MPKRSTFRSHDIVTSHCKLLIHDIALLFVATNMQYTGSRSKGHYGKSGQDCQETNRQNVRLSSYFHSEIHFREETNIVSRETPFLYLVLFLSQQQQQQQQTLLPHLEITVD